MKLLCLLVCVAVVAAEPTRYDGYKVYEVIPTTHEQLEKLNQWYLQHRALDFWKPATSEGSPVHVMIPPKHQGVILRKMDVLGLTPTVLVEDVQQHNDEVMSLIQEQQKKHPEGFMDHGDYNNLDTIYTWMTTTLLADCAANGLECAVENAGDSHEGREILVFRLGSGGSGKSNYYIDATTHAREWLSTATITTTMNHMVTNYGSDSDVTALVNGYDWVFIPVVNPDGYSYTWTNTRLWRKNRRPQQGGCIGADLNRNFDFRHCMEGASTSPCSDTFCGVSGNSEPETQAVANVLAAHAGSMLAMVTIHAYGRMWMHPWGNTVDFQGRVCERADDHDDMYEVAQATGLAIQSEGGQNWAWGTSCEVIYQTTGATDDYAKGALGIKYSFNPELRGSSFTPQPSQIQPSFEEFFAGIIAMVEKIDEVGSRH